MHELTHYALNLLSGIGCQQKEIMENDKIVINVRSADFDVSLNGTTLLGGACHVSAGVVVTPLDVLSRSRQGLLQLTQICRLYRHCAC